MSRFLLIVLLLAAMSSGHAQDDEARTTAAANLASRRVFRGVERSGTAAQGALEVTDNGWRAGLWTSRPFAGNEPGEIDLDSGYTWKATDQLKLEALVTQFWYDNTALGATKRSTEGGLSAAWTARDGVTLNLAYYHDVRLDADTLQGAVAYSQPLSNLGVYLEWNFYAGTVSGANLRPDAPGPPIKDDYTYYGADLRIPYRIGGHTLLVAGLHVAGTDGQNRLWSPILAAGGVEIWTDLGLSFDF